MRAEPRGRHRRSTPAAWPRAWTVSLAVLLVVGAFGVGELVFEVGDDPAGGGTPAIIRPSADTPDRTGRQRKDAGRREAAAVDRTPVAEPDVRSTTPDVRARRTSRRDAERSSSEPSQSKPRPTATASEDPSAEPSDGPTSDPTDEPTREPSDEPSDEPTGEPSDEPTEDDDGLLPPLPGNGSDQSRAARSSKNDRGAAVGRR